MRKGEGGSGTGGGVVLESRPGFIGTCTSEAESPLCALQSNNLCIPLDKSERVTERNVCIHLSADFRAMVRQCHASLSMARHGMLVPGNDSGGA